MADIPGNTSTGYSITGTGTVASILETSGDSDWWRLNLVAGRTYDFTLSGDGSATSLEDAYFAIRDAAGNRINYVQTYSGGPIIVSLTATISGTYYLDVSDGYSDGEAEGSYIISARMDDLLPNDNSTTGTVTNGVTTGKLETSGDADRYRVQLTAGQAVDFVLTGDGSAQSLDDARFLLLDANGNTITYDQIYSGGPLRLSATAGYTGAYYIVVSDGYSDGEAEGNFRITARLTDNVLANVGTTASVRDGMAYSGKIDAVGDADWVRFSAAAGVSYSFTLSGLGTASSLEGKKLILRDASGNEIDYDSTYGSGAITVNWKATSSGPVYLDVRGNGSEASGDYRLSVASDAPVVTGTAGNDYILAGSGNNLVQGLGGHDVVGGGAGNDTLIGGGGNDTLWGGEGVDLASFAAVTSGARIDLRLTTAQPTGEGPDVLIGIENLLGGSGSDMFIGTDGANMLNGAAGNDTLDGGLGNDILIGGAGGDLLVGSGGNDLVLFNTSAAMVINLATNTATGEGNDRIYGIERVQGGSGSDRITGSGQAEMLLGMAGHDTIVGGDGADSLMGGDGFDFLQGGYGGDLLDGGAGNDRLVGQFGNDSLRGGLGADVFVRAMGEGTDHVLDWQDGLDRAQIIGASSFAALQIVQWGADVHVRLNGEIAVIFDNCQASTFTAADFIF